MNLYQSPDILSLALLLSRTEANNDSFTIAVNDSGEVLLDAGYIPQNAVPRFKFYIQDLKLKYNFGHIVTFNLTFLDELFKNILYCWENKIKGEMDYHQLANGQLTHLWNKMFRNYKTVPGVFIFTSPN